MRVSTEVTVEEMEGNNLKIITNTFRVLCQRCSSRHFVYINSTTPLGRNYYYLYRVVKNLALVYSTGEVRI